VVNLGLKLSTEKMHNPEVENYILFGGLSEDFSEELLHRGKEGARIHRGFCNRDQVLVGTSTDDR